MSIYSQILRQFEQKLKCSEFSKYELSQLTQMLNQLAQKNCDIDQFDTTIAQQINEIVPITYDKKIILRDYIATIQKIFEILSKYIAQTQQNLQNTTHPKDIEILRQNIMLFTTNRDHLCSVFCLPTRFQSKILIKLQKQEDALYPESQSLKAALVILISAICVEIILMLNRFIFLNCLVYTLTLAIFILNYFDRSYIRFTILALFLSIIFDIVWCLTTINLYTKSIVSDFHIHFGKIISTKVWVLNFTYFTTIILMVAKFCLIVIFFRFRNNTISTKKKVKIFGFKIHLQNNPQGNPLSKLLMKSQVFGEESTLV